MDKDRSNTSNNIHEESSARVNIYENGTVVSGGSSSHRQKTDGEGESVEDAADIGTTGEVEHLLSEPEDDDDELNDHGLRLPGSKTAGDAAASDVPKMCQGWGLTLAVLSAFMYAIHSAIVKLIPNMHTLEIATFRYFLQALFIAPFLYKQMRDDATTTKRSSSVVNNSSSSLPFNKYSRRDWTLLTVRAIVGGAAHNTFYFSITLLPLADASAIYYSSPVFCGFMACLILHEPCGLFEVIVTLLSLCGVVLITRPTFLYQFIARPTFLHSDGHIRQHLLGSVLALVAAICLGANLIAIRRQGRPVLCTYRSK